MTAYSSFAEEIKTDIADSMNSDVTAAATENQAPDGSGQTPPRPARRFPAILGALLTIAAWVVLFWSGFGSFCVAGAALVVSLFGIRGRMRNLAVTSIVAAAVLMLVFAIFEGLIFFMLSGV